MAIMGWFHIAHLPYHHRVARYGYSTYKVCVVGSGPAGFYTVQRLLKHDLPLEIDMIEKLPAPYGLIRYGVAPDHPEVKNCTHKFQEIVQSNAEKIQWFGNIHLGQTMTIEELCSAYDNVVLAIGAQKEQSLNVANENLDGIFSSQKWVQWVNGYPNGHHIDISSVLKSAHTDRAVIIGHGNVALDVARLLLSPIEKIRSTDISHHAIEALKVSRVRHINIVGRRGPGQVAFTAKELRELFQLCQEGNVDLYTNHLDELSSLGDVYGTRRGLKRVVELMKQCIVKEIDLKDWPISSAKKSLTISFLLSPKEFSPGHSSPSRVSFLHLTENKLSSDSTVPISDKKVCPMPDHILTLRSPFVIKCIGYQVHIPSLPDALQAGQKVISNDKGKVVFPHAMSEEDVKKYQGLYVVGWCKTGPVGVIATTLADANETADTLVHDIRARAQSECSPRPGRQWLIQRLKDRDIRYLTFSDWLKIDEEEKIKGKVLDKVREKFVSVDSMIKYSTVAAKPSKNE